MKECNHLELNNWFFCEHAQRRKFGVWLNSGHPCKFSTGSMEGVIYCNYGFYDKAVDDKEIGSNSNTHESGLNLHDKAIAEGRI